MGAVDHVGSFPGNRTVSRRWPMSPSLATIGQSKGVVRVTSGVIVELGHDVDSSGRAAETGRIEARVERAAISVDRRPSRPGDVTG